MPSELGTSAYLAFAAGVLSVLSPCVLPLMPAYLSLISGITVEEMQEGGENRALRARVLRACLGFIAGFSAVFVLLGVGAFSIGQRLRSWHLDLFGLEVGFGQLMGVIVVFLGLHMAGLTPIRALYRDTRFHLRVADHSALSTFLVGATFALGWSPCIGPILATILGLAAVRESALQGALLLSVYSAGLAVPFLLAGWSIELFFGAFQRIKQHFHKLEVGSGMVLVAVGLLLVSGNLTWLNSKLAFLSGWLMRVEQGLQ